MYGLGYGYGFYMDWTYIFILIGAVISMMAQSKVKSTFSRYARVQTSNGLTGAQAAAQILQMAGIHNVNIVSIGGSLTDHYDPVHKTLSLSQSVYNQTSVAAVGVAAHECGHAIQDKEGYAMLRFRGALVPVCNFGSHFSWLLIILGVILSWNQMLIRLGIALFCAVVLFHLVTLPVELNASARALRMLEGSGMLIGQENEQARQVLSAAAMTYVAGAATAILQLLRLILIFGNGRGRRR